MGLHFALPCGLFAFLRDRAYSGLCAELPHDAAADATKLSCPFAYRAGDVDVVGAQAADAEVESLVALSDDAETETPCCTTRDADGGAPCSEAGVDVEELTTSGWVARAES